MGGGEAVPLSDSLEVPSTVPDPPCVAKWIFVFVFLNKFILSLYDILIEVIMRQRVLNRIIRNQLQIRICNIQLLYNNIHINKCQMG